MIDWLRNVSWAFWGAAVIIAVFQIMGGALGWTQVVIYGILAVIGWIWGYTLAEAKKEEK